MNTHQLKQILSDHSEYLLSEGKDGKLADFTDADLTNANLSGIDLTKAIFKRANLKNANLSKSTLLYTDFSYADLENVIFYRANFRNTCFIGANLSKADFEGADLRLAILTNANLEKTQFCYVIGNRVEICSTQIGPFSIAYTHKDLAIGCTQKSIKEWKKYQPPANDIDELALWEKYSPLLFQILELCPAKG